MNVEKLVFSKLFKEELAVQKVELGVVDDISKAISDASSTLKVLQNDTILLSNADKAIANANTNADKVASESEKNVKKSSSLLPKIGTILDKADQAAKGLGLDSKGITGYVELDKLYFALESAQKEAGINYKFQN
jgi:hypothetical protein